MEISPYRKTVWEVFVSGIEKNKSRGKIYDSTYWIGHLGSTCDHVAARKNVADHGVRNNSCDRSAASYGESGNDQ